MAKKLNQLGAVNIVLSNIGMAPVSRVDDNDNPMVALAANLIEEVSLSLQSEAWVFNTERAYPFTPNEQKEIDIPENVLSLDTAYDQEQNVIIRGGKLYDKRRHSYKFDGQQQLNVVWLFDFDDLPEAFKNYITMRAANLFAGRSVGSAEQVKFGEREEMQARAAVIEYETQQGDYNMLGTVDGRNTRTYRPAMASIRY